MASNDAEQQLSKLRERKSKLEKDKARAETRVEDARKQRDRQLGKLKVLGISNPKNIPTELEKCTDQVKELLTTIEEAVPETYRVTDGQR